MSALQLFFLPKGVEINTNDQSLIIYYFFKRPITIYSDDMQKYTSTKVFTKSTIYDGVLIHKKSGRKYLFDDFNIKDYKPIKNFLEDCNIPFAGNEKFKNISYFISFFKYK